MKRSLRKISKFKSVDDNLPKIQSKFRRNVVTNVPDTHPDNIEDLFLTDSDKLEFFYTLIHNYQIQNNVSEQDFFVHSRDKRQILEILGIAVDAFGTLFGSFNAYKIQKLWSTLNQFVSKQNILAQVTVKHEKEFKLMHEILSYLLQTIQTLAKQESGVH